MASLSTRALLTLSFLILVILVCQADKTSQRRSVYCDRRCLYFVNKMLRLKHRNTVPNFEQYESSLERFCRSAKIESNKCTEFFGYALKHTDKSQSSWSICQNSKVCKADQQTEKKAGRKEAQLPSSCKVCDVLKKTFGSSLLRKQLSVLRNIISTVCKDTKSKEIHSSCGFVNKHLTAEKIEAMILLKPDSCENYLCNKAAVRAFAFLPRSVGSCKLCHKILNMTLDGIIGSMKIVDTVLQDVDKICDQLKTASEKTICRNAVQRTKKIFDYVIKELKITDLCEGLRICPGNKEDEPFFQVAKSFLSAKSESKACPACESVERVANGEMVNLKSKISAIKSYMDEACADVTDENLRKKCAIAKPIVSMASRNASGLLNADNCRNLMCGGAATFVKSIFPASEKSCSICKTTMKIVADGLKGTVSLVNGILKDVDGICDSLSSAKSKKACHYAISQTREIFKIVFSKLDFSKICTDLGFCKMNGLSNNPKPGKKFSGLLAATDASSASSEACPLCDTLSDNAKTAATIVSAQFAKLTANVKESCESTTNNQTLKCVRLQGILSNFKGDLVSNVLLKNCRNLACSSFAKTLIGKIPKGPKACYYCKYALNITSMAIKQSGALIHTILKSVSQICNDLKSEASKKKCLSIVDETKVVFDFVLKRLDFSSICKDLGLCPKEDSPVAKMYSSLSGKDKSAKCPLCDSVNKVGQDRFAMMQKAVFKLIKQVSGSCKEEQDPEVTQMCALTLANIKKMEGIKFPSNVCGYFLCSSDKAFPSFASKESCTICQNVAKIVSSSLGGAKQVVGVVLNDVEALCSRMKSKAAQQKCNFAVKETKIGFQLLMKSLEPGTVCKDLHLCNSWQKTVFSQVSKMGAFMKGSNNIDLCSSCKTFLDSLKTKDLKNGNVLAVCNSFGDSSMRHMCTTLSSKYSNIIASQRSNTPSAEICAKLQICSKSNKGQQVLQMLSGVLGKFSSLFME